MKNRCLILTGLTALLLLAVPLVNAPCMAATPEEEAAVRHYDQGVKFVNDGAFLDAIASFNRAYELDPQPRFLFNVGRTYHVTGRYREARVYYLRFLDANDSPKKAEIATKYLERVERELARLVLRVGVDGTTVEVDGNKDLCQAEAICLLDPGEHRLVISAPGHTPDRRRIRLIPGENREEQVKLAVILPLDLPTRKGAVWRSSLFPGMGQLYAGHTAWGATFLTSELISLSAVVTGVILEQYYTGRQNNEKETTAFRGWDSYINTAHWTWVGGAIAAGTVWVVNVVHAAAMPMKTGETSAFVLVPISNGDWNGFSLAFSW